MEKKLFFSIIWIIAISFGSVAQEKGSLTDTRNAKPFKTVKIGTQTWMVKNLDVTTFRNGDTIQEAKTSEMWNEAGISGKPAWCYYKNNPSNGIKLGKLYNWFAVNDSRGLAPNGWHVPKFDEFQNLVDNLGGNMKAGKKMKSISGWKNNGNGNNQSGFNGLPAGYRENTGNFYDVTVICSLWISRDENDETAWVRDLIYLDDGVLQNPQNKINGYSVRCLKD